ncbi:hypothetical protein GOV12_05625 [Candidatus Pacearchaeota archaeon]|nr:hypothetical protein [Candidatus Pacearchaeota archaeon]
MENEKHKESSKPHFAKIIDYTGEPWRTDIILGQKESNSHGHIALSGSAIWFLRDEEGKVIVEDGEIVMNTS